MHTRANDKDLSDEIWDVRETYAAFGRAFYMACVLEVGLSHALMFGEFMSDQLVKNRETPFDLERYQSAFDKYMDEQFSQTMGNIICRVDMLPYFDAPLKQRILAAKKRRDFLTHHYWRERSIEMATAKGRSLMQNELHSDAELFGILDKDIEAALKPAREKLGIDDAVFDVQSRLMFEKMKSELSWGS